MLAPQQRPDRRAARVVSLTSNRRMTLQEHRIGVNAAVAWSAALYRALVDAKHHKLRGPQSLPPTTLTTGEFAHHVNAALGRRAAAAAAPAAAVAAPPAGRPLPLQPAGPAPMLEEEPDLPEL